MSKTNNPMFEKCDLTLLVQFKAGFKEVSVYEMDNELYFNNGGYYLRIKRNSMTTNPNIQWVKFSNNKVPAFTAIGWAKSNGKWVKAPKRTQVL